MKNFFKILGIIATVAIIGFSIVGCSNGGGGGNNNVIPAEWTGTYTGGTTKFNLKPDGSGVVTGWTGGGISDGTYTGYGIGGGGTISGGDYSGTWVYLTYQGANAGIIIHFSPEYTGELSGGATWSYVMGAGDYGAYGAPAVISGAKSILDITFSPEPSANWPDNVGFTGGK